MEIKLKKGDQVKLEKLSDDKFNGFHPNGIDAGYVSFGELQEDVTIGERCLVTDHFRYLNTSTVTEIVDENTFKTRNSTYKITPKVRIRDGRITKDDSEEAERLIEELNQHRT